jgi:AbrB family looped-hinge helix DNA binding protein
MIVKVDSVGRILIPKQLREALGITPGSSVDLSWYGSGLQVIPHGRSAYLIEEDGRLVIHSDTDETIDDTTVFALLDEIRR